MISSYLTSAVRTAAGYLVAWLMSLPLAGPVEHDLGVASAQARQQLAALFVFALGTVYYLVARAIEHRWPVAGYALGVPTRPVYPAAPPGRHALHQADVVAAGAGVDLVNDEP